MTTKKFFYSFSSFFALFFLCCEGLQAYPGIHRLEKEKSEEIKLGKKHMMIINCDNEVLFGVAYFAVFNETKSFQKLKFPVLLPKKTSDFEVREGVKKESFILGKEGLLFIEQEFKPGVTLVGIDFKVPYGYSEREPLKLELPFALEELSVSTSKSSGLSFVAEDFTEGLPDMLSKGDYFGVIAKNLEKGSFVSLSVRGLPESHFFSQLLGLILGGLSLLGLLLRFYLLG